MSEYIVFFKDGVTFKVSGESLEVVASRFPSANIYLESNLSVRILRYHPK